MESVCVYAVSTRCLQIIGIAMTLDEIDIHKPDTDMLCIPLFSCDFPWKEMVGVTGIEPVKNIDTHATKCNRIVIHAHILVNSLSAGIHLYPLS